MKRVDASRRRFLGALGLGLGSRVLLPVATLLHDKAWGSVPPQKRVVFISLGAGLPDTQLGTPSRSSETQWNYHPALAPLAPWRSKTVIVSGLGLPIPGAQHTYGMGLLSCSAPRGGAEGSPTAATLDQVLGARLSVHGSMPALLFGIDQSPTRLLHTSLFASGPNQAIPYPVRENVLFERVFPNSASAKVTNQETGRVLERLRFDIGKLRGQLAGEERRGLDQYLGSLDAFDRRRADSSCTTTRTIGTARGVVPELPRMLDLAVEALRCGVTNVVGCAIGGGNSHWSFPAFVGPHLGTRFEAQGFVSDHGHDPGGAYEAARDVVWRWVSEQVATFLRALEAPGPDGRRLMDDTVVVLFSDSGSDHHGGDLRFVVIGDAGGGLRTGGRFLTYAGDIPWEPVKPGSATVNSFFTALATGVGVPLGGFGTALVPGRSASPLQTLLA